MSRTGVHRSTAWDRRYLVLSVLVLGVVLPAAHAGDVAVTDVNGVTTIALDGQPLLKYRSQPNPMKLYVAKWYTPDGTQILRDSPHDHVHHRALMYAIGIDDCDFWSEVPATDFGRQVPVHGISTSTALANGRGQAVIEQTIHWVDPRDQVLATELRKITAHVGTLDSASLLTWSFTLTPEESRPQVELWGRHYFGLGARFVESMDTGSTFLAPSPESSRDVRGSEQLVRANWCAVRGQAEGKSITVAMFDAPDNPRHPATWFTMNVPFAYLSATLNLDEERMTITRDLPLRVRYGVAAWDGQVDQDTIERAYQAWLALP